MNHPTPTSRCPVTIEEGFTRLHRALQKENQKARPARLWFALTAAYHALHFLLTATAFFFLLMFGLFGLAVALEKGIGAQAFPAVLWAAAGLVMAALSIAHGISKAQR